MTTTDVRVLHQQGEAVRRASTGAQNDLICVEAPAGAEASIGLPLVGQILTVDGAYVCLIPIAGLAASVKCRVNVTLDSMTVTSAGPDELAFFDPEAVDVADAIVITAGSGDGSVSTDTQQVATLVPTGGVYARYTLTLGSAPGDVTVNLAEWTGL